MSAVDVVSVRVETVARGDHVFPPHCDKGGHPVEAIECPYDDDTFVVVYRRRTLAWDRGGAVDAGEQLVSLVPMRRGERISVVRGELAPVIPIGSLVST